MAGSQPLVMEDARPTFDGPAPYPLERFPDRRNRLSALNRIALTAFCLLAIMVAGIASIPLSDAVQDVARMVMTQRRD